MLLVFSFRLFCTIFKAFWDASDKFIPWLFAITDPSAKTPIPDTAPAIKPIADGIDKAVISSLFSLVPSVTTSFIYSSIRSCFPAFLPNFL